MADEPITFSCERCGHTIGVARGLSGVTIRCPSCGEPTAVPAAEETPAAAGPPAPMQDAPAARPSEPQAPATAPGPFAGLPPQPGVLAQPVTGGSGLATASLICGILAIVPFVCVGWITGLPAILLGIMALQRGQPRGLAIAGIVTGGIGTLIGGLMTAVLAIPMLMAALQGNG